MNLRKLSADIILVVIIVPWCAWVTVTIFSSQKAEAVTDTKYSNIMEILKEIKEDLKCLKHNKG